MPMLPHDIEPEMVIKLLESYGFRHIAKHTRGETIHAFCYRR